MFCSLFEDLSIHHCLQSPASLPPRLQPCRSVCVVFLCLVLSLRVVHGIIAINRYLTYISCFNGGDGCPFCSVSESVLHLFAECQCLTDLFSFLRVLFEGLRAQFALFYLWPQVRVQEKECFFLEVLKKWIPGSCWMIFPPFKRHLVAQLGIDVSFYKIINSVDDFVNIWVFKNILCSVSRDTLVLNICWF